MSGEPLRGNPADLSADKRARLADVLTVACPACGAKAGVSCTPDRRCTRLLDGRGVAAVAFHLKREERYLIEREFAHSLTLPKRGGVYWCPDDEIPPPATLNDGSECRHTIAPGLRRCECACVRLPPVDFRVRLLVFAPEHRRVRDHEGRTVREERPPIVLRIDAPLAAQAYVPGDAPRQSWDDWQVIAAEIGEPEYPGLWTWTGTLTVGWPDDDLDNMDVTTLIDEPELRFEGEWRMETWPAGWDFANDTPGGVPRVDSDLPGSGWR